MPTITTYTGRTLIINTEAYYGYKIMEIVGNTWGLLLYDFNKSLVSYHQKLSIISYLSKGILPPELAELTYINLSKQPVRFCEKLKCLNAEQQADLFNKMILMIKAKSSNGR